MDSYTIIFNYLKEFDKSIMVKKKTKKINKVFFIPKSIIINKTIYQIEKSLWKDVKYMVDKISLELPKWYVDKELGFRR